jgi:hypothetical protein
VQSVFPGLAFNPDPYLFAGHDIVRSLKGNTYLLGRYVFEVGLDYHFQLGGEDQCLGGSESEDNLLGTST